MDVLEDLLWLSRNLGDRSSNLAILAEGNASARDAEKFWVKASGHELRTLSKDGLSKLDLGATITYLDQANLTDEELHIALEILSPGKRPSVEAFMHAALLAIEGVNFVAHTHPVALLSLLCVEGAEDIARSRLFPDEIVCCGPEAVYVEYADPGLPLAQAVRLRVEPYMERWGERPKTIWLENHGLVTLGATAREALAATLMQEKAARVWLGSLSQKTSIRTLTSEQISRIHTRPDEHYRQQLLRQLTQ